MIDCLNIEEIPETKRRLVEAAIKLMMAQGYNATTVDRICAETKLTKGSFFHYFKSKEEIGKAAIGLFSSHQNDAITVIKMSHIEDPLDRFNALLDGIESLSCCPDSPKACLVGNLAQEMYASSPEISACCNQSFEAWIGPVSDMLKKAKSVHAARIDFDPQSVAKLMLSIIQGTLVVAKIQDDPSSVMKDNINHLRTYVNSLFKS